MTLPILKNRRVSALGRREVAEALLLASALPLYFLVRGLTEGQAQEAVRRSGQLAAILAGLRTMRPTEVLSLAFSHASASGW